MPYGNLDVYRKAYTSALDVHRLSLTFPRIEQFAMADQLRRATKSIPANIAEGMGKQSSKAEVRRFLYMALGSCDETRVWLEFSKDLGYLRPDVFEDLEGRYDEIGRMLRGVIKRYV